MRVCIGKCTYLVAKVVSMYMYHWMTCDHNGMFKYILKRIANRVKHQLVGAIANGIFISVSGNVPDFKF
jgi:hypothetical protein